MKRFSMLNMASGAVYPRLWQPDAGGIEKDDRAFLLRLYGGNAFTGPGGVITFGEPLLSIPDLGITFLRGRHG